MSSPGQAVTAVILVVGGLYIANQAGFFGDSDRPAKAALFASIGERPKDELAFIEAVNRGANQYRGGSTDLQKGAARPARAKAICASLPQPAVTGWLGQIETLSTNGDGDGVFGVLVDEKIEVKTWNNSLSDIGDHTLIKPDSALYESLMHRTKGEVVSFSGTFIPSRTDCVRESSLTLEGSMQEPEFVFRFSSVTPR